MGMWNKDPTKWHNLPLEDKLDALRNYYCNGPGGARVDRAKEELDKVLKEAIKLSKNYSYKLQWAKTYLEQSAKDMKDFYENL